ncbi:MAG: hypothetical protein FJZ01_13565 [Candidatus Sericytochromatia bacterium]|nr:hypothetical protein [Candidatus Tanganyikabacteria bacterium]
MRSSVLVALGAATLATAGCQFYSYVSSAGDLGIDCFKDTEIKAALPSTEASKSAPVAVLVHGYTATTYETNYAAEFLKKRGYIVSQVMMGAHGTNLVDFSKSTWRIWAEPVATEYNRLTAAGYQNVSLLTVSTGGPVAMELYAEGKFNPPPKRISMVAPILDFADKLSGAAGLLKALGAVNSPSKNSGSSKCHWYSDRPIDAVLQLVDLTEVMKGRLRGTINLPPDLKIQIFQSLRDKTVDPLSAQIWANGLKGGMVSVTMVDSDFHVPIGPEFIDDSGKNTWTDADRATRDRILEQVAAGNRP